MSKIVHELVEGYAYDEVIEIIGQVPTPTLKGGAWTALALAIISRTQKSQKAIHLQC